MQKRKFIPVAIILLVLILFLIFFAANAGSPAPETTETSTHEGITYLKALEAQDPGPVENTIKAYYQQKLIKQREARLAQLENGEVSVWSLFEDYVLLGDSRTMGFDFYEYLDKDRVIAEKGDSILSIREHIPEIVKMNPSYLFISYGANDIGSGMWASAEEYAADLAAIIQELRAELPDVTVFVNSILLAYEPAYSNSSSWYDIPEYNSALSQMCSTLTNCHYIDNTSICETYSHLYESDGIHVMATFYSHWAANMILTFYDSQTANP